MKISAVILVSLINCFQYTGATDRSETLQEDIEYVAPSGIKCVKCAPGTHFLSHCVKENTISQCELCEDGKFTRDFNTAEYCDTCKTDCETADLVPVVNCSHSSDLTCDCPSGTFNLYPHLKKYHAVCQDFGVCSPGYGVLSEGSSVKNTTCVRCVFGKTFSSTTSAADKCEPCRHCGQFGVQKECTLTHDRTCNIKPRDDHKGSPPDAHDPLVEIILPVVITSVTVSIILVIFIWMLRKSKRCCWKGNQRHNEQLSQISDENSQDHHMDHDADNDQRNVEFPLVSLPNETSHPPPSQDISSEPAKQLNQSSTNIWGSYFTRIMNKVGDELIANDSWKIFLRDLYQASDENIDPDTKINEYKANNDRNIKEQIYQCLKYICVNGATPEIFLEVLKRNNYHSLESKLRQEFPSVFTPAESLV